MKNFIEVYDEKYYYDDTPEIHKQVFDRVIKYFEIYNVILVVLFSF